MKNLLFIVIAMLVSVNAFSQNPNSTVRCENCTDGYQTCTKDGYTWQEVCPTDPGPPPPQIASLEIDFEVITIESKGSLFLATQYAKDHCCRRFERPNGEVVVICGCPEDETNKLAEDRLYASASDTCFDVQEEKKTGEVRDCVYCWKGGMIEFHCGHWRKPKQ